MGLMHRVLDLQSKTPDPIQLDNLSVKNIPTDEHSFGEHQSILEELLVQALQSIPLCPDGFMGIYQAFHLLRDLFGFEKLIFFSPSSNQESILEPLIHFGMQPGSLLHLQIHQNQLENSKRYFQASKSLLEVLTAKDRESVESPYYCIQVGLQKPLGLLMGSSPFTTQDPQGVLAFGPIAQLLDTHSPRFLDFTNQVNRSIPFAHFLTSLPPSSLLLQISLEQILENYKEQYSDVIDHQARWILSHWLEYFLPDQGVFSWNNQSVGFYAFPHGSKLLYQSILAELKNSIIEQFGLELPDDCIQLTQVEYITTST